MTHPAMMMLGWMACKGDGETDTVAEAEAASVVLAILMEESGSSCTSMVDENIVGASPYEAETGGWVNTNTSPYGGGTYAVLAEGDGSVVLSLWGYPFVGTRQGDTITATYSGHNNYAYHSSVAEAGFAYTYDYGYGYDYVVTLTLQEDGVTWVGTMDYGYTNYTLWEETDVYDIVAYSNAPGSPSFVGGTLSSAVFSYLDITGFGGNDSDSVECEDPSCMLHLSSDCHDLYNLTATVTTLDPASIDIY